MADEAKTAKVLKAHAAIQKVVGVSQDRCKQTKNGFGQPVVLPG